MRATLPEEDRQRNAPFLVEKPQRFRPEMLVLIEVGANRMVATEAVEPRLSAEAVAEWAGPKIESGVTVRVETEELASALHARLVGRARARSSSGPDEDVHSPSSKAAKPLGIGSKAAPWQLALRPGRGPARISCRLRFKSASVRRT